MAVMVRVPTPLRRLTNGQDKLEVEATNISEIENRTEILSLNETVALFSERTF